MVNSPDYKQYLTEKDSDKYTNKSGLTEDLEEFNSQHADNEALIFDQ